MKLFKRLFYEEEGVTLIEYALIAALIAIAAIVTLQLVGTNVNLLFSNVADNLDIQ